MTSQKFVFSLAILLLIDFANSAHQNAIGAIDSECVQKAEDYDCDFFQCFSGRHWCTGGNNYAKLAHTFCTSVKKNYESFNAEGKQWADRVITCMVDNMHGYYHAETVDCQLMKKLADEARHICLNNEGFCEVAWRNKIALIKSFGFKGTLSLLKKYTSCSLRWLTGN